MLNVKEMTTLTELIRKASDSQLRSMISALAAEIATDISADLKPTGGKVRVGSIVQFKPRKTKPAITGTVVRINGQSLTVENCTGWSAGARGWRIPPHMATVVG